MRYIILLLIVHQSLTAQVKYDYNWIFGYGGGSGDEQFGISQINFKEKIDVTRQNGEMEVFISNAAISDTNGSLLFYTNGCYIADKNHQPMPNSEGLNPGEVNDLKCKLNYGYSAGSQSCLILPSDNDSLYYLIHNRLIYQYEPSFDIITDKVLCTTVNINLNNGDGAVIEKNKPLIENDDLSFGELHAVKHANGKDWWIFSPRERTDQYVGLHFSDGEVVDTVISEVGGFIAFTGQGSGQVVFSPDGNKFARYNEHSGVYLYDFDRSTGLLSNYRKIKHRRTLFTGGTAFSPNSRYLYFSSAVELFQMDTEAEDLEESILLIGEYDGYRSPFATNFYQQQLGPDCRIYMNSTNGVDVLHVINHPDRRGLACDFRQHAVQLPTYHQISLPHFPNYRLGVEPTYPCDSTIVLPMMTTAIEYVEMDKEILKYYPNPARDVLNVEISNGVREGTIRLINALGEVVLERMLESDFSAIIDVSHLPAGVYYIGISEQGKLMTSNKVIITK